MKKQQAQKQKLPIPPKEYERLLKLVKLKNIALKSSNCKLLTDKIDHSMEVDVDSETS